MADSITLVTADDPPVQLSIPRAALITNSAVFHDLLSLPTASSTTGANPLEVAEAEEELKPFLSVLCGKGATELRDLEQSGWEVLATLADKYDSETARVVVREKAMSLLLDKKKSPVDAFVLAAMAQGSNHLLQVAALEVFNRASSRQLNEPMMQPLLADLEKWKKQLKGHAKAIIKNSDFEAQGCDESGEECESGVNQGCWDKAMRTALASFDPEAPFVGKVQGQINETWVQICSECRRVMEDEAASMQDEYVEGLPAFPV
ncbi:hypothetical protein JCM6882_000560 [Rhodosporidiobolus microsporus]